MLRNDGYDLYSFDLNDFMKGDYNVTLYIKEYSKEAGEINSRGFDAGGNKILFSQFTEEEKKAAKELGLTKGMKRGIFYKIDRINLALIPNKADSVKIFLIVAISRMVSIPVHILVYVPLCYLIVERMKKIMLKDEE